MTSREIAEMTGKEHKNVLVDIRAMLLDLDVRLAEFSADLPDSYGRPQPGFSLPKRETLILVSGYSVAMRAKIIDRWQELETLVAAPAVPAIPTRVKGHRVTTLSADALGRIETHWVSYPWQCVPAGSWIDCGLCRRHAWQAQASAEAAALVSCVRSPVPRT